MTRYEYANVKGEGLGSTPTARVRDLIASPHSYLILAVDAHVVRRAELPVHNNAL